jgi:hypothetical protein
MKKPAIAACMLGLLFALGCGERATVEGTGGRKLTLVGPDGVTVKQGDIAEMKVAIKRENLGAPVQVTITNLPAGVKAIDSGMSIVGSEGIFHLQAEGDAALVANHQATLTAAAPEGIAASVAFSVTVTAKE